MLILRTVRNLKEQKQIKRWKFIQIWVGSFYVKFENNFLSVNFKCYFKLKLKYIAIQHDT